MYFRARYLSRKLHGVQCNGVKYFLLEEHSKFWVISISITRNFFSFPKMSVSMSVQVNLFQKHLFLHQLTHNTTTDCSLNYEFSTRKIPVHNMLCTKIVLNVKTKTKKQFLYITCSELVNFLYWTCNSMNNLSSYCVLTDSIMSASDTDLPVSMSKTIAKKQKKQNSNAPPDFFTPLCNGPLLSHEWGRQPPWQTRSRLRMKEHI